VAPQPAFDTLESMETWVRGLSRRAAR
jgi:hypothetical protein